MGALDSALQFLGIRRPPVVLDAEPMPLVRRRAARPSAGQYILPALPMWQQLQRIGGQLTPVEVSGIIRDADAGYMKRLMDLLNDARQKDCHLQSILATSEESVAGLPWTLELPEKAKLKEKKAAEWVERQLRSCRNFTRFIAHQAGAVYYGHAVSEILWAKVEGRLAPVDLRAVSPRRFIYEESNGALCWWDEIGKEPVDIRAAYPQKFVVSQPRVNGDVPCREGLGRVLAWAALFRNWAMADWLKLGEIAWKPWRWGVYGKSSGDDEINDLIGMLEEMASTGVGAYPETSQVKIEWPKGSAQGGMHRELFTTVGSEMSKAVLGQTLTTEQGEKGARALGQVHDEVRKDLREFRAQSVADDVQRDLVDAMYLLNFGEGIRAAKFVFLTEDARDLSAFSTAIKTFVDAGLRIPAQWVRDEAGMPEPDEDEEIIGGSVEEDEDETDEEPEPEGDGTDVEPDDAQDAVDDAA